MPSTTVEPQSTDWLNPRAASALIPPSWRATSASCERSSSGGTVTVGLAAWRSSMQPPSPAGASAIGVGSHGYHVGLLWRPGIEPVPGSFAHRNHDFWHSLASVALDLGGRAVRHAVYHAPPFGRKMRFDQNELIVAFLARPAGGPPTLVGADWNGESADRVQDESTREWLLYEPGDPYAAAEWFE